MAEQIQLNSNSFESCLDHWATSMDSFVQIFVGNYLDPFQDDFNLKPLILLMVLKFVSTIDLEYQLSFSITKMN